MKDTELIQFELFERYSDILTVHQAREALGVGRTGVYKLIDQGLLKCFKIPRPMPDDFKAKLSAYGEDGEMLANNLEGGLPVVSLTGHVAFSTAFQNDNTPALVFAQQVNAYGQEGDVLVAFSTSGNSKNCIYAAICAKARGMKVITLTGGTGGKLAPMSDVAVIVPAKETYQVQELHLPVYHCLCAMLEEQVFGK